MNPTKTADKQQQQPDKTQKKNSKTSKSKETTIQNQPNIINKNFSSSKRNKSTDHNLTQHVSHKRDQSLGKMDFNKLKKAHHRKI